MNGTDGQLWTFAVRTYRQPGIAEACIALQDERGADVNMLMYCLWAGTTRTQLGEAEFTTALDFSRRWNREVVTPQRNARRWMKKAGCALTEDQEQRCLELREQIKAGELAAEKLQLAVLERTLGPAAPSMAASDQLAQSVANLRRYCTAVDIELDDWVMQRLTLLIGAGVSSADLATIETMFKG